ncbi:MAG: hypothetical protein H7Z17_06565, partial [Fuerstia sp.]|nr:hypothetical protein [Fuerstiella sp.]
MPIKHVLLSVGLVLTVNQRILTATAMPQFEPSASPHPSQITPHTSLSDLRQSAFDPHGYDSGLWRSAYLARPAEDDQTADDDPIASSVTTHSAAPETASAGQVKDKTSDSILYSDNLAMVPIEIPVIMGQAELQATGEPEDLDATTLSDWEYAVVKSGGS